jgi:PKD repeat protein
LVAALVVASGLAVVGFVSSTRPASPAPLQAMVQINRTSGPHPLTVAVSAVVTGGTPPYHYTWTFGDGGTASAAVASHVYHTRGTYQVLLHVTDQNNHTAVAASVTVNVAAVHQQTTFLNATSQSLGAGESMAWIRAISIPSTENSTWVYGETNVTGCSAGGNCDAYVEILDAQDEANLTKGGVVANPIWCFEVNGTCQSTRSASVAVNLDNLAGETVYFVVFNDDLVFSQTVSALVWSEWWY